MKEWKLKRKSYICSLTVLNYNRKRRLERGKSKILFTFLKSINKGLNIWSKVQVTLLQWNQQKPVQKLLLEVILTESMHHKTCPWCTISKSSNILKISDKSGLSEKKNAFCYEYHFKDKHFQSIASTAVIMVHVHQWNGIVPLNRGITDIYFP